MNKSTQYKSIHTSPLLAANFICVQQNSQMLLRRVKFELCAARQTTNLRLPLGLYSISNSFMCFGPKAFRPWVELEMVVTS